MSPPPIDDETVRKLVTEPRWKTLVRVEEPLVSIANWDRLLMRQPRVLVPIDVQALYVPEGSGETFVRLPFAMTTPDGKDPEPMPEPFADGVKRPAGVHLHWAMPDSLLDGTLSERDRGAENRLSLPPLPDRWVVLRLAVPREATRAAVRGWVIEADRTAVTPLADWPSPGRASRRAERPSRPRRLPARSADRSTGAAATMRSRTASPSTIRSTISRDLPHGRHRRLRDLSRLRLVDRSAPRSARRGAIESGPAGAARCAQMAAHRRSRRPRREREEACVEAEEAERRDAHLGRPLQDVRRWHRPRSHQQRSEAGRRRRIGGLFAETASHFATAVAHDPYASLLHGVIHGVPVAGDVVADQRPSPDARASPSASMPTTSHRSSPRRA